MRTYLWLVWWHKACIDYVAKALNKQRITSNVDGSHETILEYSPIQLVLWWEALPGASKWTVGILSAKLDNIPLIVTFLERYNVGSFNMKAAKPYVCKLRRATSHIKTPICKKTKIWKIEEENGEVISSPIRFARYFELDPSNLIDKNLSLDSQAILRLSQVKQLEEEYIIILTWVLSYMEPKAIK